MKFFLAILVVIMLLFGILFMQNQANVVDFRFINQDISKPLVLVLAVLFGAGLLTGLLLFVPPLWKKSRQVRTGKKRIMELESELAEATMGNEEPAGEEEAEAESAAAPEQESVVEGGSEPGEKKE